MRAASEQKPVLIGSPGRTRHLEGIGREDLEKALTFVEHAWESVGEDMVFKGYRRSLDAPPED